MQKRGGWGGPGRGGGGGGRGRGGPRYTPATTLDNFVQSTPKSASKSTSNSTSTAPTEVVPKIEKTEPTQEEAEGTWPQATAPTIYTVGYGGIKATDAFVERLKANGITRLLDIRISPHCGFNRDFTGRAMGVLLRKQGIAYEHFMELGNVWRSDDSEAELDTSTRLRLYRELITTAGELLTRRLRQRVQDRPEERICILCACGDVRECHRNIVATYLQDSHSFTVQHI